LRCLAAPPVLNAALVVPVARYSFPNAGLEIPCAAIPSYSGRS
jgi:hypothetical protein